MRRTIAGAWLTLPATATNGAWTPAAHVLTRPVAAIARALAGAWSVRVQHALPVLALLGLIAIILTGAHKADAPSLMVGRAEAEAAADAALAARGINLPPDWHRYSTTRLASEESTQWQGHTFVWREAGHEAAEGDFEEDLWRRRDHQVAQ